MATMFIVRLGQTEQTLYKTMRRSILLRLLLYDLAVTEEMIFLFQQIRNRTVKAALFED